jgi:cytochrome c oxidase subunit 2
MNEAAGSFYLPPVASQGAAVHDAIYDFIIYLSIFFTALITALVVYFAVKYRRTPGRRTSPVEGNQKLEILWSVIPAIILVVIFVWGFRTWMDTNLPPADTLDVRVLAKKWSWEFDYPKEGVTGSGELVVPVGRPVKLTMSSADVIHSFFAPAFRIKKDVLPNRYTVTWFEANKTGIFDLYCAEYCGTSHSKMITRIKVLSAQEYKAWIDSGGGLDNLPPIELGKALFKARGCNTCHSVTTDRAGLAGPPLAGKYGTMEKLQGGQTAKVDDNYLRESILEPNAKIVEGYTPAMPTFQGRLNDKQLNGLIDYLKSLK